jgi:hypothetical protein
MTPFSNLIKRCIVSCRTADRSLTLYASGKKFCLGHVIRDMQRAIDDMNTLISDIKSLDTDSWISSLSNSVDECDETCVTCERFKTRS